MRGTSAEARPHPALVLGLVCIAVLAYTNALGNLFVLDDRGIILDNPLVQHPASAWRAFGMPYWPATVGGGQYRPLGIVAFALDHAMACNTPFWYHAVNLAWHAAVVVLVYCFALGVLAPIGAAVAGLVFALHPVHVEAVANVVGRLELMAAAFALVALLLHRRRHWGALVAYAAALCSKESAVMIPLLAAACDLVLRDRRREWPRRLYAGYGLVTGVWGAMLYNALHGTPITVTSAVFADHDLRTRWLTVLSVVPHYLRLLVAPVALSSDYEPNVIVPALSISLPVLAGAALLIGWALLLVRAWRRAPTLGLALLWFPVAIAPVSNVLFASGVALAERTLYLPSVGLALVAGWMADRVPVSQRTLGAVMCAVLALAAATRTWTRTPVWRDARSHALGLVQGLPESYRAHWVAGRVLRATNNAHAADREFAIARGLYGRDVALLRESATLASQLARPQEARTLLDSADSIESRRVGR